MKYPIRILQVVTTMNLGGLENFLMNIYRNIDRKKIQFDFLMHRQERGAFDDEIESLGGIIYRLNPISPLRYLTYKKELKEFFEKNSNYSVVHSHLNESSILVLGAAKKAKIPIRIAHSHIAGAAENYTILRNIMKKHLGRVSTNRFACSTEAGTWLYGTDSFQLLSNSIDTSKFKFSELKRQEIRDSFCLKENDVLVGNVSRFNTQKNHQFLVKVFFEYHCLNPNSKLVLIGEGDLEETIKKQIEELGITNCVLFTGAIQHSQDFLNAMDIYLFPSLFEGLPLALVEAQCNGLPILMSDTISPEVILSDLVHQLELTENEKVWAEKMTLVLKKLKDGERESSFLKIKEKGFDVVGTAAFIQTFYLASMG